MPNRFSAPLRAAAALVLVAAVGCNDDSPSRAAGTFEPLKADTLTVATNFPVAGFWEGTDVHRPDGGFEYRLAEALMQELDLSSLKVVDVSFPDLVQGKATGYDIGLAQVSVTRQRRRRVDFSISYLTTPVGVVGRPGTEVEDLAAARQLRWGVAEETTEVDVVEDLIRPDTDPSVLPTTPETLSAVAGGFVDVAAVDYVRALIETAGNEQLTLAAQVTAPQHYAAVLPKGSRKNVDALNSALRRLTADGTLARITDDLYAPFRVDENALPTIRVTAP